MNPFSNLLFAILIVSSYFFIAHSAKNNLQNKNKPELPRKTTELYDGIDYSSTLEPSYYNDDYTSRPSHALQSNTEQNIGEDLDEETKESQIVTHKPNPSQHIKQPVDLNNYKKPTKKIKTKKFSSSLFMDPDKNYFVQWKSNLTHITFEVQVKTLGWVGLGLSPNGGMTNSDIAIMWVKDGKLILQDRFAYGFREPDKDEIDDLVPLYGYENGTHTIVGFSRLLDTCDTKMDRIISHDTVHLCYAYHSQDPPNNQLMKHEHKGSRNVYLLDPIPDFVEPEHSKKIIVTANKYQVPLDRDTTYRCVIQQLKDINQTYHLVGIKPLIDESSKKVVHHMLLHLCDKTFTNPKKIKQFMCYDDKEHSGQIMLHCFSFLLSAWAVGGPGYLYPKDLGLPIDRELNGRYMVLETHYNTPKSENFTKDIFDSSGVVLYLTDKLRKIESGQLFGGTFDFDWGVMIPPKQKEFSIYTLCSSECTSNMVFPEEGINIFSFFLHTHLAGIKVRVKVIRNGTEIESAMKDDNYDFNYQENRNLLKPIKIMKGDTILTECIYNTEHRTGYTYGGLKTTDEMCLIFFSYYPKTEFTVCGSYTNYPSLIDTLGIKNLNMTDWSPAKVLDFNWSSVERKRIVNDQMNTTRGKSSKLVKKLVNYYKNADYDILCRYMALPQLLKSKIPQYEPYIEPSSCESTEYNDYE